MAEPLSTASETASDGKILHGHESQDVHKHDSTVTAAGPSNLLPCVQCVGGELNVDAGNPQKQHSFDNFDVHPFASESEQRNNFVQERGPQQTQQQQSQVAFSGVQIQCPTVIEVFCGSARVTACLKELGLKTCFGVDHKIEKAESSAKQLDLTVRADQELFFNG